MGKKSREAAERITGECVAIRSRRLGRIITRIYDDALRRHGVTASQLGLLATIELHAPVTAARLGEELEIDTSTLSRNLKRMEDLEWLGATSAGRARELELTTEGRRILTKAARAWKKAQTEALERLGKDAPKKLDALLD